MSDQNDNKSDSLKDFVGRLCADSIERKRSFWEPLHYAANCHDIDLEAQMNAEMKEAAERAAEQAREEVRKKYASQRPGRWNESKKDMAFCELARRLSSDD